MANIFHKKKQMVDEGDIVLIPSDDDEIQEIDSKNSQKENDANNLNNLLPAPKNSHATATTSFANLITDETNPAVIEANLLDCNLDDIEIESQ